MPGELLPYTEPELPKRVSRELSRLHESAAVARSTIEARENVA